MLTNLRKEAALRAQTAIRSNPRFPEYMAALEAEVALPLSERVAAAERLVTKEFHDAQAEWETITDEGVEK